MKKFKNIIIGATFYAAGLVSALAGDTLVIEKNIFCGAEFAQSLNVKPIDFQKKYSASVNDFLTDLKHRNIIGENGFYSALPVSPCLAKVFKNADCTMLFDTVVTEIKTDIADKKITVFNSDGFFDIGFENLYDTTDVGYNKMYEYAANNALCAVVNAATEIAEDDFSVVKGHLGEFYLKAVATGLDYKSAREKLLKIAEKNHIEIIAFSPIFSYNYECFVSTDGKNSGVKFIPSAAFSDFATAFDCGLKGEVL